MYMCGGGGHTINHDHFLVLDPPFKKLVSENVPAWWMVVYNFTTLFLYHNDWSRSFVISKPVIIVRLYYTLLSGKVLGFAVPFYQCEQKLCKNVGPKPFSLRQSGIKFFTFFFSYSIWICRVRYWAPLELGI